MRGSERMRENQKNKDEERMRERKRERYCERKSSRIRKRENGIFGQRECERETMIKTLRANAIESDVIEREWGKESGRERLIRKLKQ
jgi:hypothetical protein